MIVYTRERVICQARILLNNKPAAIRRSKANCIILKMNYVRQVTHDIQKRKEAYGNRAGKQGGSLMQENAV